MEYKSPIGMFQIIVGTGGINHDRFSNQEPYVVYQQDSSYGFLNIDVIDQENVLIGKYYTNSGDIINDLKSLHKNKGNMLSLYVLILIYAGHKLVLAPEIVKLT